MCVCVCVCVLNNSKTMKPLSLKLCIHSKGTPRKCKSENWMFGLIKTSFLKIINGLVLLYTLSGDPWPPHSLWGVKAYTGFPRWGLKPPWSLACSTMAWIGTGHNDFFTIKFFFHFPHSHYQYLRITGYIAMLINILRCQRSWLHYISTHAIASRIS